MNLPMLLILLAAALAHFAACLADWRKGYLATKPLLVPLLLCFYLLSARSIEPLVVLALACGFAGDVVLELPQKSVEPGKPALPLLLGLGAFFLGHVFYIALFLQQISSWPMAEILLLATTAAVLFLVVLRSLWPHMGEMKVPCIAYMLVLLAMGFFAVLSALTVPAPARLPGGLLFLLSDLILARSIFIQKKRYSSFFVMLTYLGAQFLLVLSLL